MTELSSFLTDYLHTFTILIILCFFTVKAFTVEEIGSLSNLFEIFQQAGFRHPVSGNHDGSYLTMTSKGVRAPANPRISTLACSSRTENPQGILFGIIHICANFGLVIVSPPLLFPPSPLPPPRPFPTHIS